MKKLIALILMLSMLCTVCFSEQTEPTEMPSFGGLNDPKLPAYLEDDIYAQLEAELGSDDYVIENIQAVYISQEYLDELAYNSQSNVFFGYTLEELDAQFEGTKYVFTLGDNNQTVVEEFQAYDDTWERVLKNVAIGTGVIVVCVVVSVASAGAGAPAVAMIFAAAAKGGAIAAASGAAIGAVSGGVVTAIETGGDMEAVLKSAALSGSESYKWGAIIGSVTGGLKELREIRQVSKAFEGATEYVKGRVEIPKDAKPWVKAEARALNKYGGYSQKSFLNGAQVEYGTSGATRPDIVRQIGDHLEAIEVKCYNLASSSSRNNLYTVLQHEIRDRITNMPAGTTQRIVLDVTERGYSMELINTVKSEIWDALSRIYADIPIDIIGL